MVLPGVVASSKAAAAAGGGAVATGSGKKYTRSASGLTLATTSITWCAWAKMTTAATYAMVVASDDAGSHYCQFGVSSGGINLFLSNGGTTAFNFTTGTWTFIAATIDRTAAENWIYYANAPATTLTREFFFANPSSHLLDTNTFSIGGDGFGDPWAGSIAAVKVWNAVLTQTELTAEAAKYAPQRTANLWGAYSFQSGPQTTDDSGNSRTLTAVGTPTLDASGPPIT
jgi:hypothetical protein